MSFLDKIKKGAGIDEEKPVKTRKSAPKKADAKTKEPVKKAESAKQLEKPDSPEPVKETSKPKEQKPSAKKDKWPEQTAGELAVDVFTTEADLIIQTAIAGVSSSDLDVAFDNDMIILSGNRMKLAHNEGETEEGKKYFYQECYWGPFSRKIVLPEEVDTEKAEANMKQGILTIKIPRAQAKQLKRIIVKEG